MPKLTPMQRQYQAIKAQYPDAILMFRLGDFYEMFGEDAVDAARILDIVLTSRHKGERDAQPMCGVPYHAVDNYLGRLIKAGRKVAICEQVEDPEQAKGIVERDVVRVVSPGTYDGDGESSVHRFVLSVVPSSVGYGLAWADVTTGTFCGQELREPSLGGLIDTAYRLRPKELLVPEAIFENPPEWLAALQEIVQGPVGRIPDWVLSSDEAERLLCEHFGVKSLEGFGLTGQHPVTNAGAGLIHYLQTNEKQPLDHLTRLQLETTKAHMTLDATTVESLELLESNQRGVSGASLVDQFNGQLTTPMGKRLLRQWVVQPLIDPEAINQRLEAVEHLFAQTETRERLQANLAELADMERLAARLALGRIMPRELVKLRESLAGLPALKACLAETGLAPLQRIEAQIELLPAVVEALQATLAEEPAAVLGKGGVIHPDFHAELGELLSLKTDSKQWIRQYEQTQREQTEIPSLKVGYNKVYGYYLEVTKVHASKVPERYTRKQTLVNAERYITDELKTYEAKILGADERIVQLEQALYAELTEQLKPHVPSLQTTAAALAELDVLLGFARTARAQRYTRPEVNASRELVIKAGRHPVIERLREAERFVPNDAALDAEGDQIMLITGPNMAGKSTYLRQVALITLLAQMGSFVPAEAATIGVVDRIFTRIGASDNLARGQSTFMVEMQETANILNNATERSLIILDEIGRGTSTYDGLSIAWAVVEYLHGEGLRGPRTLFATHYHELIDLANRLERVRNFNIAVRESAGNIIFLRKIVPGGVDDSYGVQVAKLAGLPPAVVKRASAVLKEIEARARQTGSKGTAPGQRSLFEGTPAAKEEAPTKPHPVVETLKELKVETMTPLDALVKLAELKRKTGE